MPFVTEDEIKTMVDAGEETGVVEKSEKAMIYGVFGLSETTVREVMVPRVDIAMIDGALPLREVVSLALKSGYSRLPVYKETMDNIVGILHVKDLLGLLSGQATGRDVDGILRAPSFVPETKPVDVLLREMQATSIHMAIVVDEYGGTAGLVTIEDLLEEIVGEIHDEHDREEAQVEHVDDKTIIVSSRVSLNRINELLDLELASDDVDSIGGYVAERLEKVPARGDRLEAPDATIEVVAAAGRRAKRIKVTRTRPPAPPPESE
jgi:CBS domain containing-hemolysin-like protein